LLASFKHGPQPRAPELAIDPAFRAKGAGEANAPTIAFPACLRLMPTAHSQALTAEGVTPARFIYIENFEATVEGSRIVRYRVNAKISFQLE
jgi:hypothetical protein